MVVTEEPGEPRVNAIHVDTHVVTGLMFTRRPCGAGNGRPNAINLDKPITIDGAVLHAVTTERQARCRVGLEDCDFQKVFVVNPVQVRDDAIEDIVLVVLDSRKLRCEPGTGVCCLVHGVLGPPQQAELDDPEDQQEQQTHDQARFNGGSAACSTRRGRVLKSSFC